MAPSELKMYLLVAIFVVVGAHTTDAWEELGMENGKIKDTRITASSSYNMYSCTNRARLNETRTTEDTPRALGMKNNLIPDSAITASTEYSITKARRARLDMVKSKGGQKGGWSPKINDVNQWLQVDLNGIYLITGVITQGRQDGDRWVTAFKVDYSNDGTNWKTIGSCNGKDKVFPANSDHNTKVTTEFPIPVEGRFIRIRPYSWYGFIAMRIEILGRGPVAGQRYEPLELGMEDGRIEKDQLTASSCYDQEYRCVDRARLNQGASGRFKGAWSAKNSDPFQWIQVDFHHDIKLEGIVTQGKSDLNQWVTTYSLQYGSNDSPALKDYEDSNGNPMIFHANSDRNTPVTNLLPLPVIARFVRILPKTWMNFISMRFDLLGAGPTGGLSCYQASPVKPVFKDHYHASGYIRLPYAELNEPFEIFFQGAKNRSRIDMYNGMDKVYYRGDEGNYGNIYKISPSTLKDIHPSLTCFLLKGEKADPVLPQSMLPDLTGYTYLSGGMRNGQSVDMWQNKTTMTFNNHSRTSTYTFAVTTTTPPRPVQLLMMGYDSLIGSHYDKYIIDYDFYDETTPIPENVFDVPDNKSCQGFPGHDVEHKIKTNPMKEMVNPEKGDRYHQLFDEFKQKYGKAYKTDMEHVQRKGHFTKHVRMIHSVNRANLGYVLDINHMADHSHDELKRMRGRLRQTKLNNGLLFDGSDISDDSLPDHIDWNELGAVSPVKDQAICGSCWSFGSAETIEGAVFVKHGKQVRLSQQMLMDCTWDAGNNGCDGGEEWRVYEWLMKNGGIPLEETYGPYLGQNGMCHYNKSMAEASIKKYYNISSGSQKDLRKALATYGPIAVGIDAAVLSFSFYSYGTYYDVNCGNTVDDLDHAVLAVGYGTDSTGQDYWLIKNSWSTYWGNNGYISISMKDNNCGVATAATYVELK